MRIDSRLVLAGAFACALVGDASARADGAFPDSSQVLLPTDKPNEILVGTNFGLLLSADSGKSWQWVCEQEIAPCARLYQLAPAPADTIFATSTTGLVSLGADACQYSVSTGLAGVSVFDAFIDPTNAARVLALSLAPEDGSAEQTALFVSSDGGQSFGAPVFQAPAGTTLSGVEIAQSRPTTVYLTANATAPAAATILRSDDGGATFVGYPQAATLGGLQLRIAAVDPTDPMTVYFRANDLQTQNESLVVTNDGGVTTRIAQALPAGYVMSTFLRQASGTLLLAALQLNVNGSQDCNSNPPFSNGTPLAWRSSDGAKTWTAWDKPPHLRGLGERGATLYAAADNFADGFAVGQSTDGGKTWTALLQYVDIQGPLGCASVQSTCASSWASLQATFGIMPGKTTPVATTKHGCSFSPSSSNRARELALFVPLLVGLFLLRRRAARRG